MQAKPGTIIDERYRIVDTVGTGGFGTVYRAVQLQLDRTVALKVLHKELLTDSDNLARFEREARTLSTLRHRNIVSFYAYGEWRGAPYMVLEYLHAGSLQQLISSNRPLPVAQATAIISQVCAGLQCAHEHGVIHRDLKPSNILIIDEQGAQTVKLIDFGLAKLLPGQGLEAQKLTETGMAIGSCQYMSPEQCQGKPLTPAADIYAVGAVLFHCLTGRLPFEADSALGIMYQHMNSAPPPLAQMAPDLVSQPGLQEVVDRALAKEPQERFADAADMEEALLASQSAKGKTRRSQNRARPLAAAANRPRPLLLAATMLAVSLLACVLCLLNSSNNPRQENSLSLYDNVNRMTNADGVPDIAVVQKAYDADKRDHLLSAGHRFTLCHWLASTAMEKAEFAKALAYSQEALALPPESSEARNGRWSVLDLEWRMAFGSFHNQQAMVLAAMMEKENAPGVIGRMMAQCRLAASYALVGNFPAARDHVEAAKRISLEPRLRSGPLLEAADAFALQKQWTDTLAIAGSELSDYPDNITARLLTIRAHEQLNQRQQAGALLKKLPPIAAEYDLLWAIFYLQSADDKQALPLIFSACDQLDKDPKSGWRQMGNDADLCLKLLQEHREAKAHDRLAATIAAFKDKVFRLSTASGNESRTRTP